MRVCVVDYGAGNVRSLVNAVRRLGHDVHFVESAADFASADKLIFPGVGAFGQAMQGLAEKGYLGPLREYLQSGKPYMGICVGMQTLFAGSDETPGVAGLGVIPTSISRFASTKAVPHMGWNNTTLVRVYGGPHSVDEQHQQGEHSDPKDWLSEEEKYYFVHSYAALLVEEPEDADGDGSTAVANGEVVKSKRISLPPTDAADTVNDRVLLEWVYALTRYQDQVFVSAVRHRNVFATQFHPEKSGKAGLDLLRMFLTTTEAMALEVPRWAPTSSADGTVRLSDIRDGLAKRIIACLDVRANDAGDLVVTKGDQYDVREKSGTGNDVRNLGKPVELAERYCNEGADEIVFLNITSFRSMPLQDLPMLQLLRAASETMFIPLTVGGGIRNIIEPDGTTISALDVVGEYFRSGADKVSIGSDAVYAAEVFYLRDGDLDGTSAIEQIARVYGSQAVVVSVDPKRVYVADPSTAKHKTIHTKFPGPNGEQHVWYQCTVKGGREMRDLGVYELVTACEQLGAGEILLNCMDKDGSNSGYDLELVAMVKSAVNIPVVASSGAGRVEHFSQVFAETHVDAALAAGIFHRREVPIEAVKEHLAQQRVPVRRL
ncbi:Histidine biosynthesis bifunctional protein hisB [Sorochytrium milnesiophthora]